MPHERIPPQAVESLSTPDRVETRLGTLEFPLGAPTDETADRVYDHLDRLHAVRGFLDACSGVSMWAARKGFLDAGIRDHGVLFFSEFMDPETLVLTGNADTVYFVTFLDLTEGPLVVDVPPLSLSERRVEPRPSDGARMLNLRTWQLGPDRHRQGMVHDPPALRPARQLVRQEPASGRDRTGVR
ncbi:DUF1254 domain-containing protein [Streptomyces massasporeus]|uniref:DUF1254 domain-containing protein n=1 Tax=Streptomyces massasporeus TaxID=67324 RepID=UPI00381ABB92